MKFEEILIFGSMIVFVGVLFFTSGGTLSNLDKLPSEVIDGKNSLVWQQAHNRLHTSKALIEFLLSQE